MGRDRGQGARDGGNGETEKRRNGETGKRRDGETVKWRHGETVKRRSGEFTHYALRITNHAWRVANSEWFLGGQCSCAAEKFRRIRRCALQLKSISPVVNIQVTAIYALRITLYDTNLFGAYAPPTNYSLIAFAAVLVGAP